MTPRLSLALVSALTVVLLMAGAIQPAQATATTPSDQLAATPAAAAEQIASVGVVSGKFVRLVIAGTRLYAGEDLINHGALSIFDISGGAPQHISRVELPGGVTSIALAGTRAYVAINPIQDLPRLFTFDVSDASSPKQLGNAQLTVTGGISQMQVAGNLVYMTYVTGGFDIYNISNPNTLTPVGGFFSSATTLAVRGNRAYITGGSDGFMILDISNPASPQLISRTHDVGGSHLSVVGNLAYVAGGELMIADLSDPLHVTLRGKLRLQGSAQQIAIAGTRAYIAASGQGFFIVDVTSPAAPYLVGAYDDALPGHDVQVANGMAYLASGGSGLMTVDVRGAARPKQVAGIALSSTVTGVDRVGNFLYVSEWIQVRQDAFEGHLRVFDVSNPAAPIPRGFYKHTRLFESMQIVGTIAYLTDGIGLLIVDVSNPDIPHKLGSLSTGMGSVTAVQVVGARAYLSGLGMSIVDISDPRRPKLLGRALPSTSISNMDVVGNLAYVTTDDFGISIVDISNPAAPVLRGTYDTNGKALAVRVAGTTAYVADEIGGLVVIDVSDPAAPRRRNSYPTIDRSVDVAIAGDLIYLADLNGGVRVISTANPIRPTLVSAFDGGLNARRVRVHDGRAYVVGVDQALELDITTLVPTRLHSALPGLVVAAETQIVGNLAYIATGFDGLQIIDITNPRTPQRIGSYVDLELGTGNTQFAVGDVKVVGNRAYVLDSEHGLRILDISNPARPIPIATVPGSVSGGLLGATLEVVGTTAYIGNGAGGLSIFDVSDPRRAKLLSTVNVGGVQDLVVVNGIIYLASDGLRIVDARNPSAPILRGSLSVSAVAYGIAVAGNLAYLASGPDDGLRIIDVSNLNAPTLRGHLPLAGSTQHVDVDGALAYVGHAAALKVVDISNPAAPVVRANFDTPGYIYGTRRVGPLLYTAAGIAGLYALWYLPATTVSIGPSGGTLNSGTDHTSYVVPAGAFSATAAFSHAPRYQGSLPSTGALIGIGHAFEVSATLSTSTQPITPSLAYTVTVTYSDAERGPAIASTLGIYAWDGDQWTKLPSSKTNPTTKTITATTSRLGIFAALGETRRVYLPVARR